MFARMDAEWKCQVCGGDEFPGRLQVRRVDDRLRVECRRCAPAVSEAPARTQAVLFTALEAESELPGPSHDKTKPRYKRPPRTVL
jgi:hypothetical protein